MSDPLSLFPARIAIGMFIDARTGKRVDVVMTPEFFRALRDVLIRVGGASSAAGPEVSFPDIMAPFIQATSEESLSPLVMVAPSASASAADDLIVVSRSELQLMIAQALAAERAPQPAERASDTLAFEMTMGAGS